MKKAITSAIVLAKPDFDMDFKLYTNATEEAIPKILIELDFEGYERLIAFMSQSLT